MIDINKFDQKTEPEMYETALEFNRIYRLYKQEITEFTYYELAEKSKQFDVLTWKMFYMDKRVQSWYSEELELSLNAKLHKLSRVSGQDRSTATNQALQTLLKHSKEGGAKKGPSNYIIYTSIPLNDLEEHIGKNVKTQRNIPEEIENAITVFERTKED